MCLTYLLTFMAATKVIQGLQLSLRCPTPGVLGLASFLLTVWCALKGSWRNVVLLSVCDMPNPFPTPSPKDGRHVFLFTQVKNVCMYVCMIYKLSFIFNFTRFVLK